MAGALLVSMPYASVQRPSLGLGLLQAQLQRAGVACDSRYLAFTFADYVGLEEYLWVSGELPYTAFAGDWVFTEALYGARREADLAYVEDVLRSEWRLPETDVSRLRRIRAYCEPYLEHCLTSVPWEEYAVVGFTSTFEQNLASLALAQRVKAAHPDVVIAFGGANWEDEMGAELHRCFGFVDFVCSGEADHSFPALVAAITAGEPVGGIRGIVHRAADGATVTTGRAVLVRDLDALPYPDFAPFFRDKAASPAAAAVTPSMLAETGRGCWWGAKSHCTFCGLNGGSMAFRSKSPERALAELRHLHDAYDTEAVNVVDNILDMRYFDTVLPRLATEEPAMSLFYEVKANLSADQVALLAAAGVRTIQPGIESMSDHVLKLMRKGTTGLQNVQLLKWCREHGVRAEWNVLYGFPGETPQDYEEMLDLFAAIWFLDPPGAYGPVRLDRFSPYHEDAEAFGLQGVRPIASYRHLYPFGDEATARIAYYFDYDHADGRDPLDYARPVIDRIRAWQADDTRGGLWRVSAPSGRVAIVDDRYGQRRTRVLEGWEAVAYDACDRTRSRAALGRLPELAGVEPAALTAFLDGCAAERIMLRSGDRHLALAVHRPARRWVPSLPLVEVSA